MKHRTSVIIIAAAFVTLVVVADRAAADSGPDAAKIFKSKCATCHGANGNGDTTMGKKLKARDLRSAEVQKQSDQELYDWVANGKEKTKMPAYKAKMSKEDIEALVALMRDLAKK